MFYIITCLMPKYKIFISIYFSLKGKLLDFDKRVETFLLFSIRHTSFLFHFFLSFGLELSQTKYLIFLFLVTYYCNFHPSLIVVPWYFNLSSLWKNCITFLFWLIPTPFALIVQYFRIFPTQESNPDLLHCRQTLYHLSHQGCP